MSRSKVERPLHKLRGKEYRDLREQVGALWKIIDAVLPALPAEALDRIPREAMAELEHVAEVKTRFPKRREAKPQ